MIAERAPGTKIAQPGKATRTPADDELTDEETPEQTDAPAVKDRRRSVFDPPEQTDEPEPSIDAATDKPQADDD